MKHFCVGTAGWTIPPQLKPEYPEAGTHLERYSHKLNCVEINSSFYRDHKPETYARWAASVPPGFRFSVKLSRHFTHERGLQEHGEHLRDVLAGISELGKKWAVLLV